MDKIVLHIGAHKTGTTAIQHGLRYAGEELLNRGVHLHELSLEIKERITRALYSGTEDAADMGALVAAEIPDARLSLISWEGFMGPRIHNGALYGNVAATAKLLCALRDFAQRDVEIVMYTRRQDTFLVSAYVQAVKEGFAGGSDHWLSMADPSRLDWTAVIQTLRASGLSLRVGFYENAKRGVATFLSPLATALGTGDFEFPLPSRNPSYCLEALRIAEFVNSDLNLDFAQRAALRKFLTGMEGRAIGWPFAKDKHAMAATLLDLNKRLLEHSTMDDELREHYQFRDLFAEPSIVGGNGLATR